MKKNIFLLLSLLVAFTLTIKGYSFLHKSKTEAPKIEIKKNKPTKDSVFTLLFCGDMMGHMSMVNAAYNDSLKQYSYEHWFRFVSPYIAGSNLSIANLEVTLAGIPYSGYPQFSSPDAYALSLKNVGFDVLVNANNHSQDKGKYGLERTIKVLDSLEINHTGTFMDSSSFEKKYPLMVNVLGCKIALLNYTYGTNGLPVTYPNIVNRIDSSSMVSALQKARKNGADLVIPIVHWGQEYKISENEEQRNIANLLARNGADAIVGMHPHVVEPIKEIRLAKSKSDTLRIPVAYSLGNFVSAQTDRYCDGGIMLRMRCLKKNGSVKIIGYEYLPFWVWQQKKIIQNGFAKGFYMVPERNINYLDSLEKQKATLFFSDVRSILNGVPEWKP